ncbi:MAG: hypothetical protein U9R60_12275, partial [Bacteroidota bacterium]|nr:hypothetical protein [Bacteroidota bacterium]
PTKKLKLTIDSATVVNNGIVPPELAAQIVPEIKWTIRQNALYKNDLMFLDFLATSNWSRPIYFANPSSMSKIFNVDKYCHLEGFVYRFMPVRAKEYIAGIGGVASDVSYDILMNKCDWGNLGDPSVIIDRETYRNSRMPKQNFLRLAQALLNEGKSDSAIAVLDKSQEIFPPEKFHYDLLMLPFAEVYYRAGATEKGNEVVQRMFDLYSDDLRYYFSLDAAFTDTYYKEQVQQAFGVVQRLGQIAKENGQTELGNAIDSTLYQQLEFYK